METVIDIIAIIISAIVSFGFGRLYQKVQEEKKNENK